MPRAKTENGSTVLITSPKDGEQVGDSFELKYKETNKEQVGHVHVFVDNEYQRGFHGTFIGSEVEESTKSP